MVTSRPRNCSIDTAYTSAWCAFPTRAAPGTAYSAGSPIRYTASAGKLTGPLSYSWSSEPERPDGLTVRATGAPLALTRTAGRGVTSGRPSSRGFRTSCPLPAMAANSPGLKRTWAGGETLQGSDAATAALEMTGGSGE